MKSRLPNNLNPNLFKDSLDVYCDDYKDRYSLDQEDWGFLIDNRVPFTIYIAVGVNGKELYDRPEVLKLLRIAQWIHAKTGSWPALTDEWEDMCPGGLIKLDVTSFATISSSAPTLPEVLHTILSQLERVLNSPELAFDEAEKFYREKLKGLSSFNDALQTIQREFDERPLCALNTNTKTRRLRFLVVAARFAEIGVDSQRLASSILMWASQHADALQAHADSKGAILASTGIRSVSPYLGLAKEIGLLTNVGRGMTTTNVGRALILAAPPQDKFALCLEERLSFLFDLFIHDRDMICPLIVQLRDGKQRKREIRRAFPETYKRHLNRLRAYCGTSRSRRQLDNALGRLDRWQRPEIYMEHIVEPRLSWLVDLQLCQFVGDEVELTDGGLHLASILADPHKENIIPITKEFLRRRYFKTIAPCLLDAQAQVEEKKPSREELGLLLNECCAFIKRNTKSLAVNRIVASTLFRYAGVVLFAQHRVAVDFRDLFRFFSQDEMSATFPWRFRWQAAQDDGYLTQSDIAKH